MIVGISDPNISVIGIQDFTPVANRLQGGIAIL